MKEGPIKANQTKITGEGENTSKPVEISPGTKVSVTEHGTDGYARITVDRDGFKNEQLTYASGREKDILGVKVVHEKSGSEEVE